MIKPEDIIEELQQLSNYANILKSPEEFFVHMQGHETELSLVLSAFSISDMSEEIINALEKQIPRKPLISSYDIAFCPVCKGSLWQIKCESNYCFRCGQKIEW